MAERPLMFSAPMVRALLAGKKTVTRRPVTWRPKAFAPPATEPGDHPGAPTWEPLDRHTVMHEHPDGAVCGAPVIRCPALAGDRIWARETWAPVLRDDPRTGKRNPDAHEVTRPDGTRAHVAYRASSSFEWCDGDGFAVERSCWTPAIHMPRWASRITLEVTSVRVERLHAIDDADAEREGVRFFDPEHLWDPDIVWDPRPFTPREVFAGLWGLINGDESWRANPWVWRIEFRRVGAEVSRD